MCQWYEKSNMRIYRHTFAEINLEHLAHNYREIKKRLAPGQFVCPMVKANGYGHGDIDISLRLQSEGVGTLGVGLVEEGLLLRHSGIQCQLLVFGIFDYEGAQEIIKNRLTPVISTWQQLEALRKTQFYKIPVHLKFDTGMHRLGFQKADCDKLLIFFKDNKNFLVEGVLTHLSHGEDADQANGNSSNQFKEFKEILQLMNFESNPKVIKHCLNSAGFLKSLGTPIGQYGVRPGLIIYGSYPFDTNLINLKPVMSLRSHVVTYQKIKKGEGVSYNHTWKAPVDTIIGVIPLGYADGYHRLLSNNAEVLFQGKRVKMVGNVCMDYVMIDVTEVLKDKNLDQFIESEVTFFGEDQAGNILSVTELSKQGGTIPWEILTSVGERVPRVTTAQAAIGLAK